MSNLWLFMTTSFLLWITPGPDTMYIIARTISQGRWAGIISVVGIGLGVMVHTLLAALGVSAILATSAFAFSILKTIGAAYLIYIGVQTVRSAASLSMPIKFEAIDIKSVFIQGIMTNFLNPKIAIFFLAFLPQFVTASEGSKLETVILGLIFVSGGSLWCLGVVLFADKLSGVLRESSTANALFAKVSGFVYVGLGLNLLRAKMQ